MRTEIKWAELHAPLFLAGTNLQLKLDPTKRSGLKMEYDEEKKHLYVTYNNQTARIPETSVLSMVEREMTPAKHDYDALGGGTYTPPRPVAPIEAQVSTPTSHVFAGRGGGTTGQEPPEPVEKRKPGRPAKARA
jgi:hypothetical protein